MQIRTIWAASSAVAAAGEQTVVVQPSYGLVPIGWVQSALRVLDDAPNQRQAQRAAVDRQRAAAVAHQLGGRKLSEPFHITGFWPAFWGAIIVGLVSWLLSITLDDKRHDREPSEPPFLASAPTERSAGPPWPGPYGNSPQPG